MWFVRCGGGGAAGSGFPACCFVDLFLFPPFPLQQLFDLQQFDLPQGVVPFWYSSASRDQLIRPDVLGRHMVAVGLFLVLVLFPSPFLFSAFSFGFLSRGAPYHYLVRGIYADGGGPGGTVERIQ